MGQKEKEKIRDSFANAGLSLSDRQTDQFFSYYLYLTEKNKVMNLTSITEFEDVLQKHFLDSVLLAKVIDFNSIDTVLDVGSGAGFPGIPLKICFPQVKLVLLDSQNKRVLFLKNLARMLKLSSVDAIHARAEDAARESAFRAQFDLCVSRAVSNLSSLSECCIPFVKRGGLFAAYKAADCESECEDALGAITLLGGGIPEIRQAFLPESEIVRSFVLIRKEKDTPSKYPRKAGTPMKHPLYNSRRNSMT